MSGTAGQKIAVNLSWLGLQEVFSRVLGFVLVIYLARLLAPADYGSLNICLALLAILALLVRAGTGSRATRLTARDANAIAQQNAEVAGMRIVIAALLIAAICFLAEPLGRLLSVPPALLMLGSLLLIRPALTVAWAFRGLDNMRPIAVAGMAERLVVLAGVLVFVHGAAKDTYTVVLLELLGGLVVVLCLRLLLTRRVGFSLPVRFRYRSWGAILREAGPVSISAIIGSVYRHGDVLLLGIFADAATAAVYLVGQKIVLTLALLPLLVGKASFPSASRLVHQDLAKSVAFQAQLVRLSLVLVLPACAIIMLFAGPVLGLLFGERYLIADDVLRLLLLSLPFLTFSIFQENLLLVAPAPRALLACRIISSTAHVLLALLLIPGFGATGAAIGCLVGQLVFAFGTGAAWRNLYGGVPIDARCLVPLLAAVVAVAMCQLTIGAGLWFGISLGAVSYLFLLVVLRGVRGSEMTTLFSYARKFVCAERDAT